MDKLKWFIECIRMEFSTANVWSAYAKKIPSTKLPTYCFRSMHERCEIVCEYSDN